MALFDLNWIRPEWLWLLPLVWLALAMTWRGHQAGGDWARVADPHLLKFLSGNQGQQGKFNRHGFKLLVATCLSIALIALAGPAWEKSAAGSFSANYARVVVLDLSRSMLAEDIKPSRSAQAQFKLIDLLEQVEEGQVGLVAFAGQAFVIAPLSSDMETIKNLVPALTPEIMPVLGSRPAEALFLAADLIRQAGFARGEIILLADSASPQAVKAAANLASDGFRISVLGIGSTQGAPIPSGRGFVKDAGGQIVVSKLEVRRLQDLASAGKGEYYSLRSDNSELVQILSGNKDDFVATDGADTALDARWIDQGYWLVLLLLPLALLLFRKGWVFILPLFILPYWSAPLQAQETEPQADSAQIEAPVETNKIWLNLWNNRDQRAEIALQNKQYEQLLEDEPAPRFQAEALYRSGAYSEAAQIWQQLEQSHTDPYQQAAAAYNIGNALAAQNELDAAIAAYERSLELNPENEDAKANLEILKQLQEQQNQEGGEQESEDQQNQEQQQEDQEQKSQEQQDQQDQQDQSQAEDSEEEEEQPEEAEEQETEQEQEQAEPEEVEEEPAEMSQEEQWTEEDEQAKEQWLRRIPDDPGGLLRRKLNLEYQRRNRQAEKNQPW